MEEKFVTIAGNKIRYLESGGSDNHIVLVHGLGASAERWEYVIPLFNKHYKVIVPDLIGFGHSDKPLVDYTSEFFSDFLSGFLHKLGLGRTNIIGSSLGGQITVEYAAHNPATIENLVLVSPSGIMKNSTPALDAYVMAALYPDIASAQNAFQIMAGHRQVNQKIVEDFVERMKLPNAKMAFMSTLLGLKNAESITKSLKKISVPTLIIWGEDDPVIPIKYADEVVSSIQDCRFYMMDNCGHTPYVDDPKKFAELVLGFLQS